MPRREFDLNDADVDVLIKIEGVDRSLAQKIIDYRESHGGAFRDWSELERIPGFTALLAERIRNGGGVIGALREAFDLNRADVDVLVKVEGVDRPLAQKIIEYRESHGGAFRDWSDVERVPGLTALIINRLRKAGVTIGKKAA